MRKIYILTQRDGASLQKCVICGSEDLYPSLRCVTHFKEDWSVLLGAIWCQEFPQLLQDIFLLWLNNIHRMDDPSGKLHNTGQKNRCTEDSSTAFSINVSLVLCVNVGL